MINCGNGKVEMNGTKVELMADVTIIMRGLIKRDILDREDLEECLAMAEMSEDEIAETAKEIRATIALASMIFGDMEEE